MSIINKEKAMYAIQTFIMFLSIAREARSDELLNLRESAVALLAQITMDHLDALEATIELNVIIEKFNEMVRAPYPTLMTDTSENLVKTEIVAFEHYLNQELKVNHLTLQQEAPLFNDSFRLWESIGVSRTAKEGALEFASLINKLNAYLPESERYPLPDINEYEG